DRELRLDAVELRLELHLPHPLLLGALAEEILVRLDGDDLRRERPLALLQIAEPLGELGVAALEAERVLAGVGELLLAAGELLAEPHDLLVLARVGRRRERAERRPRLGDRARALRLRTGRARRFHARR